MPKLHCGHDAAPSSTRLCSHLFGDSSVINIRFLSGVKLEYDLCCRDCATRWKSGEKIEVFAACQACVDAVYDASDDFEWVGQPEIVEHLVPFDASLETRRFPDALAASQAVAPLSGGRILALVNGELQIFDENGATVLLQIGLPAEKDGNWSGHHLTPRLLVSRDARFAALGNDFGRYGAVIDLEKRAVTLHLNRGEYHNEQTPFPLAFFECEGRALLVHGTNWNRLDISDPQTGELLTSRDFSAAKTGERPPHYLDYFHGQLHVSPASQTVLDDGWVWGPAGIPAWWNLQNWARENIWESEDGPSRHAPFFRHYYWNHPMCFVGEERLAIAGIGDDDIAMLDGARIFSVTGEEVGAFAGPKGAFFSDGTQLFSVDESGLQLWNVESGARSGRIEGFKPQFQIDGALVEIEGREMRRWNYMV